MTAGIVQLEAAGVGLVIDAALLWAALLAGWTPTMASP